MFAGELLRCDLQVHEDAVLTGTREEIDVAQRRLILLEVSSRRMLTCSYEDLVESMLLERPRELIRVYGTVVLDGQGRPVAI